MPIKDPQKRREYHRAYISNKYYQDAAYREKHLLLVKDNRKRYLAESRKILVDFKAKGCAFCPEKEECCLSAHHLDPNTKDFSLGALNSLSKSPVTVLKELRKCVCVCENCHRKIHAGKLVIS